MEYQILNIDGTEYNTLLTKKYANRKAWQAHKTDEIKTVIPGTVVQINVRVNDNVMEGDALCIFEAMKMQNIIRAPHTGVIRNIYIAEGDKLPKGTIMITVEAK